MAASPARSLASPRQRNTGRVTITAAPLSKPFRLPTICSTSRAMPQPSASRPARTPPWARPLSSPSSGLTAPSNACAISWAAPIPRSRSSAPRARCCAPPRDLSPNARIDGGDGGQASRGSSPCPLPENVAAGPRGLRAAAHLHLDSDRDRRVLFAAGLYAVGDAPPDRLGYLRRVLFAAGLHPGVSQRACAYPPQRGAAG